MIRLGVNIDHVATVRQARGGQEPDPIAAAAAAELGGADAITVHLRQDRRHIQERDVRLLAQTVQTGLNLELAVGEGVLALVLELAPEQVCLVPEHRQELTTEGGLALDDADGALGRCIHRLRERQIMVSLFIEPEPAAVRAAQQLGADAIELHTGAWAGAIAASRGRDDDRELVRQQQRLEAAAATAAMIGLRLHAGHGISYRNVGRLLHLPLVRELNIGHAIVSRALLVGMERAVREMRAAIDL